MQSSLFDFGPTLFDCALARNQRAWLSPSTWVDYLPNWLEGAESVFRALQAEADWQHGSRLMYERVVDVPRLTAPAPSSGTTADLLRSVADSLACYYGQNFSSVSLAWYRNGQDSVAPHADKIAAHWPDPTIAIVSVGAPRRFILKSKQGGPSQRFSLGWGDLLVMGGTCQRDWLHGVPKTRLAEPRISIVFRPADSSPPVHTSRIPTEPRH
ncbi:MAG: alpha-ketoglutarate-dependent dioxygenase AlkB [Gammaproteobacteria bacterium]|nr:alpha-ketoglutarate-dependent dioxygenase AlkB [Gammaproteobacteria bacterium]